MAWPTGVATDAELKVLKNNLATTLDGGIDDSTTTVVLADATGFPTAGFVTIGTEAISYTGISTNTLTGVTRGADNTTAAAHTDGDPVYHLYVASHHNTLVDEIQAVETSLDLTASRAVVTDGSGRISAATTTAAEIGYVNGVTSAIQTQLNAKKTVATGNAYKIETTDASGNLQETTVTGSRAVVTDANGLPAAATTTAAEIEFVNGVTSAIQTQLNAKVDEGALVFNVKDYGAVGDDSTDDLSAFNTAIAAVNSAGGGVLYIPKGVYKLTNTPAFNSYAWNGLAIRGAGVGATVLKMYHATSNPYCIAIADAQNVTISDLTIDGSNAVYDVAARGAIHFEGSSYGVNGGLVERVAVLNWVGCGIVENTCRLLLVRDVYVYRVHEHAFYLAGILSDGHNLISTCHVKENAYGESGGRFAFKVSAWEESAIFNCIIDDSVYSSIQVESTSYRTMIRGNTIINGGSPQVNLAASSVLGGFDNNYLIDTGAALTGITVASTAYVASMNGNTLDGHSTPLSSFGTNTAAFYQTAGGFYFDGNGAAKHLFATPVYADTSGSAANVFVDTDGHLYRSTSAEKYKTDIQPYEGSLSDLMALKPKTFIGVSDKKKIRHAGFSADEIDATGNKQLQVFVTKNGNEVEGLEYDRLTALLVNAVKELAAKVEKLEKKRE